MGVPYRASDFATAAPRLSVSRFTLLPEADRSLGDDSRDTTRSTLTFLPRAARWVARSYVPKGKFERWLVARAPKQIWRVDVVQAYPNPAPT